MYRFSQVLTFLFFFCTGAFAQTEIQRGILKDGVPMQSDQLVSAVVLRSVDYLGIEVTLLIDGASTKVPLDADGPKFTYFLSLPALLQNPQVQLPEDVEAEVFFIYSGKSPKLPNRESGFRYESDCSIAFAVVEQADWRAGLAAPSYSRSFTEVLHVVVHHAAGSNTNSNYVQVVRDIYVYHTEVNGWSDIGYNYLIAQDGTIFSGRDPATGEQDNVLGAHFCGKNSGTMGVCLLGNYETATATSETLTSLKTLVGFKVQKEDLDPLGTYPHAFGSLDAIIGHRDGCSTACPGENVYALLGDLRTGVQTLLDDCEPRNLAFSVSTDRPRVNEYTTFYNESTGYDSYVWMLEEAENEQETWATSGSTRWKTPGFFSVTLVGQSGALSDTLTKEDFIQVEGATVYPTLVRSGGKVYVKSDTQIESILTVDGKPTLFEKQDQNAYQLYPVDPGVYVILLTSGKTERLVIF